MFTYRILSVYTCGMLVANTVIEAHCCIASCWIL